ncbi:hypothetical protein AB0C10_16160 [Microbispora amethystogenes]|uniref:hypothetical protein n=1 Tax=Microbispora amethystogenes TaxID=1427754 RepID=UPI0033D28F0E
MTLYPVRYAFFDTETTHLDRDHGDLWEAAIIFRDTSHPEYGDRESWWQVRPPMTTADRNAVQIGRYYDRFKLGERPIGQGASISCGQDQDEEPEGKILDYLNAEEIAFRMARLLNGAVIVGSNPRHDWDFADKFLRQHGHILTAKHRMIDIRALATGYIYGRGYCPAGRNLEPDDPAWEHDWLSSLVLDLPFRVLAKQDDDTKHTALGDARWVRDVFDAIRRGVKL